MERIYMDHAATTALDPRVLKAMEPYLADKFGNASSLHTFGQEAAEAMEESRQGVATFLGAQPGEIIFTSGGTESNNLALKGAAFANRGKGMHIVTQATEHDSVLNALHWLEGQGFEVTYLPVDKQGIVDANDFENALRKDTILASIMYANNEIGTIQDIPKLSGIARGKGVLFHTDAVQAYGKIPLDVGNVDLLSLSAHKLYGPKGAGALMVQKGTKIDALLHGGGHESGKRSGTENIPGIVGLAKATEIAAGEMEKNAQMQLAMRDRLIKGMLEIEGSWLNGHPTQRLPNNANFGFKFVEGEAIIMLLDDEGIAASTGSACSTKDLKPSHVLTGIGLTPELAHGSLRITLGTDNTEGHIDRALASVPKVIATLREMSPIKTDKELQEALKMEHSD